MNEQKQFGIRISMPGNDPLSAAHLLGENWASERWYRTAEERDRALADMQQQPPWYRRGDSPSIICTPIDRDR